MGKRLLTERHVPWSLISVLVFLILFPSVCQAAGVLQGVVRDSSGKAISGALVSITGGGTATTVYNGFYRIEKAAGIYTLTASKYGYSSEITNNIPITEGAITLLDFSLFGSPLGIESVYPSLGERGKDLNVTISGSGFDQNTRVFMSPDSGNLAQVISKVYMGSIGTPQGIHIVDNIAYTANTKNGLAITDISNPLNPVILGVLNTGDTITHSAYDVVVQGNIAYLGNAEGISVVDVSDQSNPQLITYLYTSRWVEELFISGSYLYSATHGYNPGDPDYYGIDIFDISDPNNPKLKNSLLEGWWCEDVEVVNGIAYVATSGAASLEIYNVTDPDNPASLGSVRLQSNGVSLEFANGKIYIADQYYLHVVNIDDLNTPKIMGSIKTLDWNHSLTVVGNTVYVGSNSGVHAIDVSDPSQPVLRGSVSTNGQPYDLTVIDDIAYVADYGYGLLLIDVSNPRKFTLVGSVDTGSAKSFQIIGDYLYLADGYGGWTGQFKVIDISNPATPSITGTHYIPGSSIYASTGSVSDVRVVNNIAYLAQLGPGDLSSFPGVGIVDVSNKSTPQYLGSAEVQGWVDTLEVVGNMAYVPMRYLNGTSKRAFQVVDVSNSAAPSLKGLMEIPNDIFDLTVVGNIAYLPNGGGLMLVNVSNPDSPYQVGTSFTQIRGRYVDRAGDKLYVSGSGKLDIVDISVLTNPTVIGSVPITADYVNDVNVSDNMAYVSLGRDGFVSIDVLDPANPYVVGYTSSPGNVTDVEVINDLAYVADNSAGISILPALTEVNQVTFNSEDQLSATIPNPMVEGHYNLSVVSSNDIKTLEGAVTFTDDLNLLSSKAIIVAGGGPDSGLAIWNETKAYANYAYENLIFQGYKYEDIHYLTDEASAFGRTGEASTVNLRNAILNWAKGDPDTSDLLIYLVDHGDTDTFLMKGGPSPENLTAEELDAWLDELQLAIPGKVILIYDACRSGSFIYKVIPPAGKTRITLTSSTPDQVAYFLDEDHSFSSHLWSTFSGKTSKRANLLKAFERAAENMSTYQDAQLDANGNGVPNEPEDYEALENIEGTIYGLRRQYHQAGQSDPEILSIAENISIPNVSTVTLSAGSIFDIDGDKVVRVWAEIIPPNYDPDPTGLTVTSIPYTITLSDLDEDGVYEAQSPVLDVQGTYIVNYFAEDVSGNYSQPQTSLIIQLSGAKVLVPDQYEVDNTIDQAQIIVPNDPSPQNHSFHVDGDEDWVKFYGIKDEVYNIRAFSPTVISDPVIEVYDPYGVKKLGSNTAVSGEDESINGWKCPTSGLYYVRVTNNSSHFGANVRYKLKVYNPIAFSLPGYITGKVTHGGRGVAGAIVRAGGGSAITLPDGSFILYLAAGNYTVVISVAGYQTISLSVSVSSGGHASLPSVGLNSNPRIYGSPPVTIPPNQLFSFTPVAIDDDGDSLTFYITGKPSWTNFSSDYGTIWGTPRISDEGEHGPITITVKDPPGASASLSFVLKVSPFTGGSLPSVYLLLNNKEGTK